jgi:hypothetical protein
VSKAHRASHVDPRTGQRLSTIEQICTSCGFFFKSTEAGDRHRVGEFGVNRRCLHPQEAGLIAITNEFGSIVWAVNDAD